MIKVSGKLVAATGAIVLGVVALGLIVLSMAAEIIEIDTEIEHYPK